MTPTLPLADPLLEPCPLRPQWAGLLRSLLALPSLWVRTGNGTASLQTPCRGSALIGEGALMRLLGPDLDLRLRPSAWSSADAGPEGIRVFDTRGVEVLRFLLPVKAMRAVVDQWRLEETCQRRAFLPPPHAGERSPADPATFLQAWSELRDTRAFPSLLARFGLRRPEALHLAEGRFAQSASRATASLLLDIARARSLPLALFVGNPGGLQIGAGCLEAVRHTDAWTEAEAGAFTFRLCRGGVDRAWFVTKPTAIGLIRSLELFDGTGELVAQIFDHRPEDGPETPGWRALLEDLGVPL